MLSSIVDTVKQHELFRDFREEVIEVVLTQSELRQLQAGEVLIHPDRVNHTLYLLVEGALHVIIEKGNTQVSIPIHPGEFLGEISLVEGIPPSAMAICDTDSQVLAISEETFWEHLAGSKQGVKNLMHMMAQRLHRNNQALIKEIEAQLTYKQLQKDFETAGKIQANIVPDGSNLFPQRTDIEVYAHTEQARAVGGDFFDALALDQERIYLAIGDATGKGMPAALFMMRTFTSLRFLVSNYASFADVLPALNKTLARKNDDMMFVSLWAGVLNVRTGILQYVNGGHHLPFAALEGLPFQPLDLPDGPIVGVIEEAKFEVASLKLKPGDTLFLYTDGLPEALDPNQVPFEGRRIAQSLNARYEASPKALIHGMKADVATYVQDAPTHDDLTMLAFRYFGV